MSKGKWFLIFFLNLIIALGFYFENKGTGYTALSSDSLNAIPICMKIDNQELFKDDLYLNSLDNVKYYTPFYIETIRFFSRISSNDYLTGINVFATFLHLFYGIFWFYVLYLFLKKDYWVAFLLSILIRGIVWLPGFEIWGISDLWSIMPRTFYITFLPIPFIFLCFYIKNNNLFYFHAACLSIGFIFNLHPITGIGGILLFTSLVFGYLLLNKVKINLLHILFGCGLLILGILPFILTYFTKTSTSIQYNMEDFAQAFNARIPNQFSNVSLFLIEWFKFKFLFYFFPILCLLILSFFNEAYKKTIYIILIALIFVMVIPVLSIYIENFINTTFNKNLRMSFQIIRASKVVVVLGILSIGYLFLESFKKINEFKKVILVLLFILTIGLSKLSFFDSVPFFRDDISRSIFPNLSIITKDNEEKKLPLDKLSEFIEVNTPKDALFAEFYILRSGAKRSVVLDAKGASMLIEGNPIQFINWYKDAKQLESQKTFKDSLSFYKTRGVDYLVFRKKRIEEGIQFIHQENQFHLYKIE